MTYHNDAPNILEAADIEAVQRMGDLATLPDGREALPVLLILPAAAAKKWGEGNFPTVLHVTNGMFHKLLPIAQRVDGEDISAEAPAEAPTVDQPPSAQAAQPVFGLMASAAGEASQGGDVSVAENTTEEE